MRGLVDESGSERSMMTRRRTVIFALGGALLAGGAVGGAWWWRVEQRAAIVASALPPAPDLSGWPTELRERIATAESRAKAGSIAALHELSRLWHANGFFSEASDCYRLLEKLEPSEPRWWHRHAAILAGYGDTDVALACAQRAVELAPSYAPAKLRLGDLLLKRNELDRAAAIYDELLRTGDNPHALLGLARIDVEAGRWAEARTRLERVVAQTNYELGYDLIVTVYERLGLAEQAARVRGRAKASGAYRDPADPWVDELLDDCFDAYRLSLAAGTAQRTADLARAQRLLERAVALAPDDATIRFQLAGVLTEKRDVANARAQLEQCTKISSQFPDAWAHLGALLEQAGNSAGAERVVIAGLGQCPDSPGLHLMRARQHRSAGRVAAAIDAYTRSIQLRPNEADAYIELATLLLQSDHANEGVQQLLQALTAEPDHPTALTLLALTAISAGDEPAAQRWLTRVKAQPRISPEQAEQLFAAYRGQFGREFR
jgi:tetratricopeptide (TPR) repeat protein